MNREKGAAGVECSGCGDDLELIAQPDGAVAAACCKTCYSSEAAAVAEPEIPSADPVVDEDDNDDEVDD